MPITKLTLDERISDWVYATNDIIDELNNGVGDRTQLITQSKVIVSAINTIGGEGYWTETSFQNDAIHTDNIQTYAVTGTKLENNIEIPGTHTKLPTGTSAQRPHQSSVVSSIFYNGDGNEDFIITGTGFDVSGVQVVLIGNDASELGVSNLTVISPTIIKFKVPQDLDPALKPYSVKVINNNIGGQPEVTATGVLNFGGGPTWVSSGVVLDFEDYQSHLGGNVQYKLDARDPDRLPLEYAFVSGTKPVDSEVFPTGILNVPECPPQYFDYDNPSAFQFVASATDGINPAVNSGTLQINVRPSNPKTLVPNRTLRAWFTGASWNSTTGSWRDMSGNGYNTQAMRGTVSMNTWNGSTTFGVADYDSNRNFKYIQGGVNDGLIFPAAMTPSIDQTWFIVARYTNTTQNQGRIFTSKGANHTFSHWGSSPNNYGQGNAGASHYNHWMTANSDRNDYMFNHENNWIIWAGNRNINMTNGRKTNVRGASIGTRVSQMAINPNDTAYAGGQELTDFACAEFIVFDGDLTEAEMQTVSHMLGWRYGIPMSSKVGSVPRVGVQHMPANRALDFWENDLPLTINWTAQSWSVAGNATYPLPAYADGKLGTININTEQGAPTDETGIANPYLVTDRPTIIRLYRFSTWNTVNDYGHSLSTYTRRSDLDWNAPFGQPIDVYEKYVEAGVYPLDTDSAMYQFFAPDPDTDPSLNQPDELESAVIWTKESEV